MGRGGLEGIRRRERGTARRLQMGIRMGRGLVRSHRLHLRPRLRLQMGISCRLRVCHRSGRMGLGCSGQLLSYKGSHRRLFLRPAAFHRLDMSRNRSRVR